MAEEGDPSTVAASMKDIKALETSISSMNTSVNSQMQELRDMIMQFMQSNKAPISHPPCL